MKRKKKEIKESEKVKCHHHHHHHQRISNKKNRSTYICYKCTSTKTNQLLSKITQ